MHVVLGKRKVGSRHLMSELKEHALRNQQSNIFHWSIAKYAYIRTCDLAQWKCGD